MSSYNLTKVEELIDGDPQFLHTLVETFLEEIPADLAAMEEAIENENAALTYQIAHKMKPNLQLFGLNLSVEIHKLEAWKENHLTKEAILISAETISSVVNRTTEELKKDFDL